MECDISKCGVLSKCPSLLSETEGAISREMSFVFIEIEVHPGN